MKTLTIYTLAHEQALRTFTSEAAEKGRIIIKYESRSANLFCVRCAYEEPAADLTDMFAALLEQVIVQENPLFRHSAKLKKLAQDYSRTQAHDENAAQLRGYLRENRVLHLEGYAAFRMAEYRNRLDMLLYTLVKKLKLT